MLIYLAQRLSTTIADIMTRLFQHHYIIEIASFYSFPVVYKGVGSKVGVVRPGACEVNE